MSAARRLYCEIRRCRQVNRHVQSCKFNLAKPFPVIQRKNASTTPLHACSSVTSLRTTWGRKSPSWQNRNFSNTSVTLHGHLTPPKPGEERRVTFVDKEGDEHEYEVADGDNLLDIAQSEDLEMEGACGGSCACSTCHVIVEGDDMYEKIPEPDDDENDMLDLAFGLTETSRLGCQVKMTKELDGLKVKLPSMTRNLQASDFSGAKKS